MTIEEIRSKIGQTVQCRVTMDLSLEESAVERIANSMAKYDCSYEDAVYRLIEEVIDIPQFCDVATCDDWTMFLRFDPGAPWHDYIDGCDSVVQDLVEPK